MLFGQVCKDFGGIACSNSLQYDGHCRPLTNKNPKVGYNFKTLMLNTDQMRAVANLCLIISHFSLSVLLFNKWCPVDPHQHWNVHIGNSEHSHWWILTIYSINAGVGLCSVVVLVVVLYCWLLFGQVLMCETLRTNSINTGSGKMFSVRINWIVVIIASVRNLFSANLTDLSITNPQIIDNFELRKNENCSLKCPFL